jgi:hypothetical protein
MTCAHDGLYWYAAPADERGWKCVDCGWQPGEEPGFSPQHDRAHISTKVGCILMTLHEAEIIYVSNGSCGEAITGDVVEKCRRRRIYDSVSIARFILELEADRQHADFWREISEGIIAGKDPRERCACGKLANSWRNGKRACCHEHMQTALGQSAEGPF